MEAYFINPMSPSRKAAAGKSSKKRKNKMAKKRTAAQKAATRKMIAANKSRKSKPRRKSRKSRKARRVMRVRIKGGKLRARHIVKRHRRKGTTVKRHWSNPFNFRQTGSAVTDGLIAAGVLFGALFVVGYANGWAKRVPMLSAGWGALAGKLAVALGAGWLANEAASRGYISRSNAMVAAAAGFAPLGLDLLSRVAPGVASQLSLANEDIGAELGMPPGNRLSDYTMDAELAAELGAGERESESSSF